MPDGPIQSPSAVVPGEKGNKFTKYLIIILVIVAIAVVAEGVYYYTNILNKPNGQETSAVLEPDLTKPLEIDDQPILSEPVKSSEKQVDASKLESTLGFISFLEGNQNFLEEASFTTSIKGQVTEAGFEESSKDGINFVYKLTIKQEDGSIIINRFTDIEIVEAKITTASGGALQLADIVPGDIVSVRLITNLLDSSPHSKIELTVEK